MRRSRNNYFNYLPFLKICLNFQVLLSLFLLMLCHRSCTKLWWYWNLHGPHTCQVRVQVPTTATLVVVLMGPQRLQGAAVTRAGRTSTWTGGARCRGKSQKWVQHILESCGARAGFVPELRLHLVVFIGPCESRVVRSADISWLWC
jgi:hypothetical protein